jgi:hypothetical protein
MGFREEIPSAVWAESHTVVTVDASIADETVRRINETIEPADELTDTVMAGWSGHGVD